MRGDVESERLYCRKVKCPDVDHAQVLLSMGGGEGVVVSVKSEIKNVDRARQRDTVSAEIL